MEARLKDVARLAGVSVGAASRALRASAGEKVDIGVDAQRRIREAATRLNYVPNARARRLREGSSSVLGVLISGLSGSIRPLLLDTLSQQLQANGREVLLGVHGGDAQAALQHVRSFRANRTCGVMVINGRDELPTVVSSALLEAKAAAGPSVAISFTNPRTDFPTVSPDLEQVLERVLRMAKEGGFTMVVLPNLDADASLQYVANRLVAATSNVPELEVRMLQRERPFTADRTLAFLSQLPDHHRPLLFVDRDVDGFILSRAIAQAGYAFGNRLGLISYGNLPLCALAQPALTAWDLLGLLPELTRRALGLFSELAEPSSKQSAPQIRAMPRLVVRETFGDDGADR